MRKRDFPPIYLVIGGSHGRSNVDLMNLRTGTHLLCRYNGVFVQVSDG